MTDLTVGGGDVVNVTLSLQPALEVSGRVVFDGATLEPPSDLSTVSVRLRSAGSISASTTSTVDAAGAMTVSGIIPGTYTVTGSVPGGTAVAGPDDPAWRVSSVTVGGRDVTDRIFDISEAGAGDLTVTFSDLVSTLSGTLTSSTGAPETDYFVVAIPEDPEFWTPQSRRIASTRPDASGRYAFHGLPSGTYRIAVTTDLVPRDLQEFSALEQLAAQSVPAVIVAGEQRTLDLRTASDLESFRRDRGEQSQDVGFGYGGAMLFRLEREPRHEHTGRPLARLDVNSGRSDLNGRAVEARQPKHQPLAGPELDFTQHGEAGPVEIENPDREIDRHQLALDAQQRVHARRVSLIARLQTQRHPERQGNSHATARRTGSAAPRLRVRATP
jgi:hypothetical protein